MVLVARCGTAYQIKIGELGYIYQNLNPIGVRDAGQAAQHSQDLHLHAEKWYLRSFGVNHGGPHRKQATLPLGPNMASRTIRLVGHVAAT
jgi:hypothetical protein